VEGTRKESRNMAALFILIGILFIVAGLSYHRDDHRRRDFEDYVWYKFDDHHWNDRPKKKKRH